jgi:cytoskeletal protein RodZ
MSEPVGQRLKEERLARDISLEQVAQGTHIRLHYLQAIEDGKLDQLPSPVQVRGFLRAYAGYLGFDIEPILVGSDPAAVSVEDTHVSTPPTVIQTNEPTADEVKAIYEDIGKQLQHQRELLGLSLDDVERHTHLRVYYLRSLESGAFDELPSPVQARGMLNNYAAFLGLDPEPLLLQFADGLQAGLAGKQATQPKKSVKKRDTTGRFPLRRWISGDFVLGGVLILILVVVVSWVAIRVNAMRTREEPSPTVVSIADALLPTADLTTATTPEGSAQPTELRPGGIPPATPTVVPDNAEGAEVESTEEGDLPPVSVGAVQVYIVADQRTWLRVIVDGEIEFEGRVLRGTAYSFSGDELIELLIGNGAALQVFFNQRELGPLGIYGEVVNTIFTPEGILEPTPTITPTSTPGPEETPTSESVPDSVEGN